MDGGDCFSKLLAKKRNGAAWGGAAAEIDEADQLSRPPENATRGLSGESP